MSLVIFLDSGPLGLATNPNKANAEAVACTQWLISCLEAGARVCIPEICDYEVRRELILGNKTKGLARLDKLKGKVEYVPITMAMMVRAAELWAEVRKAHKPTAPKEALDADVILVAQATLSITPDDDVVIATTDVGDLSRFAEAKRWRDIAPI